MFYVKINMVKIMKDGLKNFVIYLLVPNFIIMLLFSFINNIIIKSILGYLVLLIYFIIVSKDDLIKQYSDFKSNKFKYLKIILKYTFICFILMMFSNYIINKFINVLPTNELNNRELIKNNILLAFIYIVFIAPLLEEYVFRYSFKKINNYYLYMFMTLSLFTLIHLMSINSISEIYYLIPYSIIGFGFSSVYFKTQNYFASLFSHIIHNLLCVIIIMIGL